ncbi:hypothetical protein CWI42_040090 [Ordospora colligata]|uniref:Uncharacterized protein n=1 Tax=Ordospora colligata OC4 TaxID=1354746 RepID=A0A0B2ULB9_9MICR|nr:uncharacterized protein M896_040090 [Ordospora colligata OC4]KHN69817.1 hypothetical protein M896_040090 [Ordospora colligata OC4]TBU15987.1 hypothetical protein CWI41_040090 [Ordospora colligata]TBU16200.1 hypothetical protein CWI40_040090 [Ordospora colligata]TBU18904.1 hypothetical protein CWI42_040090 [Ordospora colligata]
MANIQELELFIKQRRREAELSKKFVKMACDLEDELDMVLAEDEAGNGEGLKRRRRSVTLDIDDILSISVEETRNDLHMICGEKNYKMFIKNSTLVVDGGTFVKGNIIKVSVNQEEHVGTITSVEENGIVVKTKGFKRLKILLDDMRAIGSSIMLLKNESPKHTSRRQLL